MPGIRAGMSSKLYECTCVVGGGTGRRVERGMLRGGAGHSSSRTTIITTRTSMLMSGQ